MRPNEISESRYSNTDEGDEDSATSGSTPSYFGDTTNFMRRSILRGAAASSAIAIGMSGMAGARPNKRRKELDEETKEKIDSLIKPYQDRGHAISTLMKHGEPVLEELADSGYIANADRSAVATADIEPMAVSPYDSDTTWATLVEYTVKTREYGIRFWLNPDAGSVIATVMNSNGEMEQEVSTQDGCGDASSWHCSTTYDGDYVGYCDGECDYTWYGECNPSGWNTYELHAIKECNGNPVKACCASNSDCAVDSPWVCCTYHCCTDEKSCD